MNNNKKSERIQIYGTDDSRLCYHVYLHLAINDATHRYTYLHASVPASDNVFVPRYRIYCHQHNNTARIDESIPVWHVRVFAVIDGGSSR